MTVYVDDMYRVPMGQFGRMKMSHMIADTSEELLAMADKIGVARKWIQHPGTTREHFDISMSARAKAVAAGAVEITMQEYAARVTERENEFLRTKVNAILSNLAEHSPSWVATLRLYIKRLERKAKGHGNSPEPGPSSSEAQTGDLLGAHPHSGGDAE